MRPALRIADASSRTCSSSPSPTALDVGTDVGGVCACSLVDATVLGCAVLPSAASLRSCGDVGTTDGDVGATDDVARPYGIVLASSASRRRRRRRKHSNINRAMPASTTIGTVTAGAMTAALLESCGTSDVCASVVVLDALDGEGVGELCVGVSVCDPPDAAHINIVQSDSSERKTRLTSSCARGGGGRCSGVTSS